jgi:DNA-binding beta-propeller fold protein YncE
VERPARHIVDEHPRLEGSGKLTDWPELTDAEELAFLEQLPADARAFLEQFSTDERYAILQMDREEFRQLAALGRRRATARLKHAEIMRDYAHRQDAGCIEIAIRFNRMQMPLSVSDLSKTGTTPVPEFYLELHFLSATRAAPSRFSPGGDEVAESSPPGQNGNVLGYTINPSTGALTTIAGLPIAAGQGPQSVAVDPSGKFAYVANFGGGVSGYTINPSTGALTPIAGSPFAAGNEPNIVAVDPSGKFAYVTNVNDNNVSGYTIDPSTGALTAIAGSPFAAGGGPFSVAIITPRPLIPFASSFAKLEIKAGPPPGFDLNESFTLGKNSNGINPVTENVTLQIGTFSVTIPPGSFKKNPNGRFAFQRVINGVNLQFQIVPLGNNIFTFMAEGTGVNLTGLTNPVTVVLTIGDDTGSTAVSAQFQ